MENIKFFTMHIPSQVSVEIFMHLVDSIKSIKFPFCFPLGNIKSCKTNVYSTLCYVLHFGV